MRRRGCRTKRFQIGGTGPSADEPSKYREALVHSSSARARVGAAELDLTPIIAADADREHQGAAGVFPERRQLARDGNRMTKG
jgi:hypothetical protein